MKTSRFIYTACGLFTKKKEWIQKFNKTGDSRCIYQNKLDKACFQHDMAYADFKNLLRGTAYDKVLSNKVFNIANHPLYDGYQRGVAALFFNFFW